MFDFLKRKTPKQKYDLAVMEMNAMTKVLTDHGIKTIPDRMFWKLVALQLKIDVAKKEWEETVTLSKPNLNVVPFKA